MLETRKTATISKIALLAGATPAPPALPHDGNGTIESQPPGRQNDNCQYQYLVQSVGSPARLHHPCRGEGARNAWEFRHRRPQIPTRGKRLC